jgi:hypothetical protein
MHEVFMNNLIEKLDFGRDSAESEKDFLQKVFVPTPLFKRIKNGNKNLVLGRKGTGKTAIRVSLFDDLNKNNKKVSLMTPRNLSKLKIEMLEKSSLNNAESSLMSWKYAFLIELGMYITEAARGKYGDDYVFWPDPIQKVRKYLADNVVGKANWIDKTFKIISLVRKIELPFLKIGTELDAGKKEAYDFSDNLDFISEIFIGSISLVLNEPIYILIDQVDEIWEPTEDSKELIIGLLRASKELNELTDLLKIILFLRSDIFDYLDFHDSDKFHSSKELITWNETNLLTMITTRARISTNLETNDNISQEIWNLFFSSKINGDDSFKFILKHTLMRPRDLIQLCNLCRDKAQDSGHIKIEKKDIDEALPVFSEWKLKDLKDEYIVQYPFLEQVFLGMFYSIHPNISRDDLSDKFNIVKDNLQKKFDSYHLKKLDNLLQILYNIGFLGVENNGSTIYSYQDSKVLTPYSSKFEVNPIFRSSLGVSDEGRTIHISGDIKGSTIITGDSNIIHIGGNVQVGKSAKISVDEEEKD